MKKCHQLLVMLSGSIHISYGEDLTIGTTCVRMALFNESHSSSNGLIKRIDLAEGLCFIKTPIVSYRR